MRRPGVEPRKRWVMDADVEWSDQSVAAARIGDSQRHCVYAAHGVLVRWSLGGAEGPIPKVPGVVCRVEGVVGEADQQRRPADPR